MNARVVVVAGTRPELIKLSPVIHGLDDPLVVWTAQHFSEEW